MVYIGRSMKNHRYKNTRDAWGWLDDSPWMNQYEIGKDGTRDEVIEKYKQDLLNNPELLKQLPELKGKVLACWCKPERCHGDVLLEQLAKLGAADG
jgi:hypothetical protein